jgi:HK97 gp10 family phage protein
MSSTSVEVLFNRLPELAAQIESKAALAVAKTARDVEAAAKSRAPVDTGALRNSITAEQLAALAWIVAVGAEYGIYQEFGTYKMGAQPFLVPAFNTAAPVLVAALKALLS